MSTLGIIHTASAVAAIICGAAILLLPKATITHIWLGRTYVAAMVAMNGTSFFLQSFFGPFGPFHLLAVISLATVVAGVLPVLLKRPKRTWMHWHYYGILFSYVGLLAATGSEITVRMIPGITSWTIFWTRVIATNGIVAVVGTLLIFYLRRRAFRSLGKHATAPTG